MAVYLIILDEVLYCGAAAQKCAPGVIIFSDVLVMNASIGEYSTERKVLEIRYV